MQKKFYYRTRISLLSLSIAVLIFPKNAFSQEFSMVASSAEKKYEVSQNSSEEASLPLKDVLSQLEKKYEIRFTYNQKLLDGLKTQPLDPAEKDLDETLKLIFKNNRLKYKKYNKPENTYFIYPDTEKAEPIKKTHEAKPTKASIQASGVTGRVTGDHGIGLPGVTIILKGTNIGTVTDSDGSYSLLIPEGTQNPVLIYSFVGFAKQEIPVNNQAVINALLLEDTKALKELVVVGYGVKEKKTLTGAVATVEGEQLSAVPTGGDAASRLQGRVAGVTVATNNAPGGGAVVRVRGIGSINNNDPLYVVDGVPTTAGLSGINPNDIESMTVLKDASSSAIYGSRAANGVIVVTTKRGKLGQPTLSLDARYGVQQASNGLDLMNAQEIGELKWQKYRNDGLTPGGPGWGDLQYGKGESPRIPDYVFPAGLMEGEVDEGLYNFGNPYYGITKANKDGTNWFDEIFSAAPIQEYNLALSGGGNNNNYALSAGYLEQEGILNYTGFKRYTLRSNSDLKLSNSLKIGQSLSVASGERTGNTGTNAIEWATRIHPIIPVYDIQGNFAGTQSKGTGNAENPVAILYRDKDDFSREMRILANMYGQFDLTGDLFFRTLIGVDLNNTRARNRSLANPEFTQTNFNNSLNESHSERFQYNWTNTLNYKKSINDHSINLMVGSEAIKSNFEFFDAGRSSFAFTDLDYMILDAGEKDRVNGGYFDQWALFSYFGRVNYDYKGKYLVEGVVRRDASSRFAEANRWGTFPALSVGWRIIEEEFMKDLSWLDDLKLRAGWGRNGNDNVGNYNAYSTYRAQGNESYYNITGSSSTTSAAGFHMYKLGNPDGQWETNTTTNLGVDISMFNYRFDASLDVYSRTTTNMLYPDSRPDTWGALVLPSINIGEMKNTGLDLILTYRSKAGSDFQYNISTNLSHYKNEIVRLNNNPAEIRFGNSLFNEVYTASTAGMPISSFYGYTVEGVFNTDEEVDAHPMYNPDINGRDAYSRPGVFKYKDINGDGVITPADRTFIGSPHPDLSYGLNLDFKYKNWDLTTFFQGVAGNEMVNFINRGILFNRFDGNYLKRRLYESWTPERFANGEKISLPITTNDDANMQKPSTFFIEDGSYFRLKNIQIGYTLPSQVASKLGGIKRLRVYLQSTNLFTITKYSGLDPETSSGNDRHLGVDQGLYPTPRIIMSGVNLNF